MSAVLINLTGLVVIALIVWWFWLSQPKTAHAAGVIEILVNDGVYTPASIEVEAGRPVTLRFLRKDPSPCAEQVLFDDLGLSAELPVGEPKDITVTPPKPDEYEFTCQMQMKRGRLIVR